MRILAVSDMHGELGNVFAALKKSEPDLLLCSGDWGDKGELVATEMENLVRQITVLSVYGNHDDIDLLSSLHNQDGRSDQSDFPSLLLSATDSQNPSLRVIRTLGVALSTT